MTTQETDQTQQERIAALTKTYLAALEAAGNGGNLEDHMDEAGLDALSKLTMSAGDFLQDLSAKAAKSPTGAFVPTVTEIDSTGRPVGYDLFSLLMKKRVVLLQGQVDDSMAAVACASLLYLDSEASGAKGDPVDVYINSPGGSVIAGLAIYDTMRAIEATIRTVGFGMQASMGSILLAGGDTREMTTGSKLMIYSLGNGTEGKLSDNIIGIDAGERLFEDLKAVYIRHIGLTAEFWDLCCAKDTYFSAEQALEMGFISKIIEAAPGKQAPYEASAQKYLFNELSRRKENMPTDEAGILKLLLSTSANGGKGERTRPELLVALSQMSEYWTPELALEKQAAAKAAGVSNDNKGTTASKKTANGPSA